jgi:hypothetical protein
MNHDHEIVFSFDEQGNEKMNDREAFYILATETIIFASEKQFVKAADLR